MKLLKAIKDFFFVFLIGMDKTKLILIVIITFMVSCNKPKMHSCNWVDCDYKSMTELKSFVKSPEKFPWTVMFEKLHWDYPNEDYETIEECVGECFNLNTCSSWRQFKIFISEACNSSIIWSNAGVTSISY